MHPPPTLHRARARPQQRSTMGSGVRISAPSQIGQMVEACAAKEPKALRTLAKDEAVNIGRHFPNALPPEMTLGRSNPNIASSTLNVLDCVGNDARAKGGPH